MIRLFHDSQEEANKALPIDRVSRAPPVAAQDNGAPCAGLMEAYKHSVYITNPAALDAATFEEIALPIIVDTLGDNHVDPGGENLSWQDRGVSTSRTSIISHGCIL